MEWYWRQQSKRNYILNQFCQIDLVLIGVNRLLENNALGLVNY